MACDEYDRDGRLRSREFGLEIESAESGQTDVQD